MKRIALFLFAVACLLAVSASASADDALAAANAERAARGLPPFLADPGLAEAAEAAAAYRAAYGISGHSANDFAFLPAGVSAPAAGCAAWPDGMGFGACALYEPWTYAGAATVRGRNGLLYHRLFVSHQASGRGAGKPVAKPVTANPAPVAPACPAGGCGTAVYHSERHTVIHREGVVMPVANVVGFFQTRQPVRTFVRRFR